MSASRSAKRHSRSMGVSGVRCEVYGKTLLGARAIRLTAARRQSLQKIVYPPSITKLSPVWKREASEAR
jgi:hypothetical protein